MEIADNIKNSDLLPHNITVNTEEALPLSPMLFGFNLEHTRACINGGLSAQMLRNRKFAGKPSRNEGVAAEWFSIGGEHASYLNGGSAYVRHHHKNAMFRQNEEQAMIIQNVDGSTVGIGQRDIFIKAGTAYIFRLVAQSSAPVCISVELTDYSGNNCYAKNRFDFSAEDWETVSFSLTPNADDINAVLRITFTNRARVSLGAVSLMPADTFHGMRRDIVEALKSLSPAILRWPGGNFAGEYRWMDGLLPVDMRAPLQSYTEIETQPYTHGYDFHEINTDDFIALCRYVGAEPFLTINPVWESSADNAAWVEYCNGDETTEYGKLRISRGFSEPYNVKYWSLGNEMGYGHMEGPNTPEKYSALAREHLNAMLEVTPELNLFSSGPYPRQVWADGSAKVLGDKVKFVSMHHYSKGDLDFTSDEKLIETTKSLLFEPIKNREKLHKMRECLGDGLHISFDEWNLWYAWYRPSCSVDGLFAAQMLHLLTIESIPMDMPVACYFQPVGEGAIEVMPDKCRLTAIGQAIEFLSCHKGAKLCRVNTGDDIRILATMKDELLTVTLINTNPKHPTPLTLSTGKKALTAKVLIAEKILPHTYLTQKSLPFTDENGVGNCELPALSIGKITFRL